MSYQRMSMAKKIKLKVQGLTGSQIQSGAYALILSEVDGPHRIPIIVGMAEAQSIAMALEHLTPPRPLTHDLFVTFTHSFGILLQEVYIYKFLDGVFYAELVLFDGERQVRIDSRTSDAIAIALRLKVDIFTSEEVLNECGLIFDKNGDNSPSERDEDEDDDDEDDEDESYDLVDEDEFEQLWKDKSPDDFHNAADLDLWLSYMPLDILERKFQEAIDSEHYEHAKIYKDELKRREDLE